MTLEIGFFPWSQFHEIYYSNFKINDENFQFSMTTRNPAELEKAEPTVVRVDS